MAQHGIAILGAGMIGAAHAFGYRTHLPRFSQSLPDLRLGVVADPNAELAAGLACAYGFERTAADWRVAIDDPTIGIVSVALPNFLHVEAVEAALAAGKHVLCEKPLALRATDAEKLYRTAKSANARMKLCAATILNYRHIPAVTEIRDLIAAGALGKIVNILTQFQSEYAADPQLPHSWRYERRRAGPGALLDIGTHAIDTARYLCGEVDEVSGAIATIAIAERFVAIGATAGHARVASGQDKRPVDNDDTISALLRFRSGCQGLFSASRVAIGMGNTLSFQLFGTKAAVRFSTQAINQYEIARFDGSGPSPFMTVCNRPASPNIGALLPVPFDGVGVGYAEIFGFTIHEFLTAVATGGPLADRGLLDGLRATEILDAIQEAADINGPVRVRHADA